MTIVVGGQGGKWETGPNANTIRPKDAVNTSVTIDNGQRYKINSVGIPENLVYRNASGNAQLGDSGINSNNGVDLVAASKPGTEIRFFIGATQHMQIGPGQTGTRILQKASTTDNGLLIEEGHLDLGEDAATEMGKRTAAVAGAGKLLTIIGQTPQAGQGGDVAVSLPAGTGANRRGILFTNADADVPGAALPNLASFSDIWLPMEHAGVELVDGAIAVSPTTTRTIWLATFAPNGITQGARGTCVPNYTIPRVQVTTAGLYLVHYQVTFEAVDPATFEWGIDGGGGVQRAFSSQTVAAGDKATMSGFSVFQTFGANIPFRLVHASSEVAGAAIEVQQCQLNCYRIT